MKICIYGAGAIGGLLGAKLALSGQEVTLIARGPHLAAMKEKGLRLRIEGQELTARPVVTDDPAKAGKQDYVLITLKAHSVAPIAAAMQPMLGPETAVVTAMNGIPWWYFHAVPGPHANHQLKTLDA